MKFIPARFLAATVIVAITSFATLYASAQVPAAAPAATAGDTTDGEVRKVDVEGGKLTLKHAEIKNLDMPGMTMVFVVNDKAMLDKLKAGDKVKFRAINDGGKFTVTEIQAIK